MTLRRRLPFIGAVVAVLAHLALGALTLRLPLNRDEASYAVIAERLRAGDRLYVDVIGLRPPLPYWTYMVALGILGSTTIAVRLMGMAVSAASLALMIYVGARLGGRRTALVVAFLCALWWRPVGLEGYVANTEIFINLFALLSTVVFLAYLERPRIHLLVVAGTLAGLATLFKQMGAAQAAAMGFAVLLHRREADHKGRRRALVAFLIIVATVVLPWLIAGGWFAAKGHFSEFWFCNFQWMGAYSETRAEGLPIFKRFMWYSRGWLPEQFGLWVLAAAGCFAAVRSGSRVVHMYLVAWLIASGLVILWARSFYEHHFLLLLPPALLLAARGLCAAGESLATGTLPGAHRPAAILLAFLVGYAVLAAVRTDYRLYKDAWLRSFRGAMQTEYDINRVVGLEVGKLTRPGDRIFVWGSAPEIYFYSGRQPLCKIVWLDTWIGNSVTGWKERQADIVLEAMVKSPPAAVVVAGEEEYLRETAIWPLLLREYRFAHEMEGRRIYLRRE